jgi:RNA polymerase sigma factor (sigma-70 family)
MGYIAASKPEQKKCAHFSFSRHAGKMSSYSLIEDHLPLAEVIALEYANIPSSSIDDARSEAHMALMRAANAYDSGKGEFINFASRVIRNALNSLYAKQLRYARIFPSSLEDPVDWSKLKLATGTRGSSDQLQLSDPKQNVLKEVRRRETLAAIGTVLNQLSPRERILVDALRNGSSYAEHLFQQQQQHCQLGQRRRHQCRRCARCFARHGHSSSQLAGERA